MNVRVSTLMYAAGFLVLGLVALKIAREGKQLGEAAAGALEAVNPTNPDNIFAAGVNKVVQTVTGDPETTFGSVLFDVKETVASWFGVPTQDELATGASPLRVTTQPAEELSAYWQQFRASSYLDNMAREERKVVMKNLKIPIRDQMGNLVIGP